MLGRVKERISRSPGLHERARYGKRARTFRRALNCLLLVLGFVVNGVSMPGPSMGQEGRNVAGSLSDQIRLSFSRTDIQRLEAILKELRTSAPPDAANLFERARTHEYLVCLYSASGKKKEASRHVDAGLEEAGRAIELDPEQSSPFAVRSVLYGWKIQLSGTFSRMFAGPRYGPKADDDSRRALELGPKDYLAHLSRGRNLLFAPSLFGGDREAAVESLRESIKLNPQSVAARIWLAFALAGEKAHEKEAIALLASVVSDFPENFWAEGLLRELGHR